MNKVYYILVNIAEHISIHGITLSSLNDYDVLHENNDPCNCFQSATTTNTRGNFLN